jgi:cyclase
MNAVRVIPCLDVKDGRVVKGINFVGLRDIGDPAEMAVAYQKAGADEIVFLDITATTELRPTMLEVAQAIRRRIKVPFVVGGGMRTVADVGRMLDAGADKVSLNTAVVSDPELINEISHTYGPERLIVAIDAKKEADVGDGEERWEVMINGGRTGTGMDAVAWAREVARRGAGEILVTSLDQDGVKGGNDLALTRAVARASLLPTTASGGAGTVADFVAAVLEGEASGVLGASVFHYGTLSIAEVKQALAEAGVPVYPADSAAASSQKESGYAKTPERDSHE